MTPSTASRLTNLDGLKQEIRDTITISAVAESLGADLQASGDQWRSLCLLHDENTPSCYYSDAKGLYNCFGCKVGGDTIDLVQRVKHLDFIEVLYWLAAEADIDISAYERPMSEAEKAQEEFRTWCEGWLVRPPILRPNRVDLIISQSFGVAERFVGDTWGDTPPYFQQKTYLLSGTVLPWRLPSGRLVGWRVREHEGQEKKVFGTPNDFPLGKVQDTLFGIQVAREHLDGYLTLVEGEYDVMACHAVDAHNVVGMGGSTLTDAQMQLVESLHIRELVLVFDGDEGGYKAAHAAAEKWWNHPTVFVRVTVCPDGEDPEDVVKQQGEFGWMLLETTAKSALEYLLREKFHERGRNTLTEKLEFVRWVNDNYGAKLRSSDQSLVLSEVARWLDIPDLEVRDHVRAADASLCAPDSEKVLLGKACRDKQFYIFLRGQLQREDFFVLKHQRIWDILSDMLIDGQEFDALTVIARSQGQLPDDYIVGLLELSDANLEWHRDRVADFSLRRSSRDDALAFKDSITDLARPAEILVGDLTHRITTKALRKAGTTERQLSEQVDQAVETMHERMRNPSEIHGLDLGQQEPRLSRILQGLQPKRLVLVAAVSRVGKALDIATPIPTPDGWTTMGDIQVGDVVFDDAGWPCQVIATTPVMEGRPCYRVRFSDGTDIVADAEHQWQVYNRRNRNKPIVTTKYMAEHTRRNNDACNFIIPVQPGLVTPNRKDLPVDPYVLGMWLGDGATHQNRLYTNRTETAFFQERLAAAGFPSEIGPPQTTGAAASSAEASSLRIYGLWPKLREAGVAGDKHIPAIYLRAGRLQRLALLQGLMDTDGTILERGNAEFVTKSERLRDGVMDLLRSLGYKPSCRIKYVVPNTKSNVRKFGTKSRYGPYYRIHFRSNAARMPVRMPHKVARVLPDTGSSASRTRRVVAVELIDSVLVRCIQVDSPSSCYLAGEAMVPTHNSTLLCQWCASLGVHQSIPVDLVSLEMDESEILYKMCSHLTGIDSTKITGGRLEPGEAQAVEYAMARIRNSPLHIWSPDGMTGTEFLLYARESIMRRHTRAFMIDYVQLIDPEPGQERENGYVRYGEFGRLCKMKVARAMDVSVICAAQLRREAAGKDKPTGEDLADSYALMRHTDVLFILHSPSVESSTLEGWVDKNRQGAGGGLVPMIYDKPTQTFREVEAPKQPEYLVRL